MSNHTTLICLWCIVKRYGLYYTQSSRARMITIPYLTCAFSIIYFFSHNCLFIYQVGSQTQGMVHTNKHTHTHTIDIIKHMRKRDNLLNLLQHRNLVIAQLVTCIHNNNQQRNTDINIQWYLLKVVKRRHLNTGDCNLLLPPPLATGGQLQHSPNCTYLILILLMVWDLMPDTSPS